jgi:hypothetical protein
MGCRGLVAAVVAMVLTATASAPAQAPADPPPGQRVPAKLYFGAYRFNEQLVADDARWDFVQQHMDGMIFHFGYWLNNDLKVDPVGVGKKLAERLKGRDYHHIIEIGWPSRNPPEGVPLDQWGEHFAERYGAKLLDFEKQTGLVMKEQSGDYRLFILRFVGEADASLDAAGIVRVAADEWGDYVDALARMKPGFRTNVTFPPIYVPWNDYVGEGRNFRPEIRGQVVTINGADFFEALFSRTATVGFVADSPYGILTNPAYVQRGYQSKLLAIQAFLHGRGRQFSYIVNGPPRGEMSDEEWDRQYTENSLNSIRTFQSIGGRADQYIFESWYRGPFTLVPEDQPNTFTNQVKQGILYLKGPGQKLSLSVEPAGAAGSHRVTLRNDGEVRALPTLRLVVDGPASGWQVRALDGDRDVTAAARSEEGHPFVGFVDPGQSASLVVSVARESNATTPPPTVRVEAMWNPQDPSGEVRARAVVPTR